MYASRERRMFRATAFVLMTIKINLRILYVTLRKNISLTLCLANSIRTMIKPKHALKNTTNTLHDFSTQARLI